MGASGQTLCRIIGAALIACAASPVPAAESEKPAPLHFARTSDLRAFVQAHADSDVEQVKLAVAYLALNMAPWTPDRRRESGLDINGLLASDWGECGVRDVILHALFEEMGLKARRIGFDRVPIQGGHVATEVLIDGRWLFFDATFGVYFTDDDGRILSIDEARRLWPGVAVHRVRKDIWSDKARTAGDLAFAPSSDNLVFSSYRTEPAAALDRTYFISNYWGSNGARHDTNFVVVNLKTRAVWKRGQIDGGAGDYAAAQRFGPATEVSPMPERVGMYYEGNIRQAFNILTDEDGVVEMRATFLDEPSRRNLFIDVDHSTVGSLADEILDATFDGKTVAIRFAARKPMTTVYLSAPWNGHVHTIDAVEWTFAPAVMRGVAEP